MVHNEFRNFQLAYEVEWTQHLYCSSKTSLFNDFSVVNVTKFDNLSKVTLIFLIIIDSKK